MTSNDKKFFSLFLFSFYTSRQLLFAARRWSMAQIYMSAEEAAVEFQARKNLRMEVEAWWASKGWSLPPLPVAERPIGVLARCVATFRYEEASFLAMCERAGIMPAWLEFTGDTFVSTTFTKLSLLQIFHCSGLGRKGGPKVTKDQFASANEWNGKPLNTIERFKDRRRLVDYHHELLRQHFPEAVVEEMTGWLRGAGGNATGFYEALLSLFVGHAIQFEDYDSDSTNAEATFRVKKFEPAYEATLRRFGVAPMIVKLPFLEGREYNYPVGPNWRDHGILPPEFGGRIPKSDLEPEGVLRIVSAWQRGGSAVTIDFFLQEYANADLANKVRLLLEELEKAKIAVSEFLDSGTDEELKRKVGVLQRRLVAMWAPVVSPGADSPGSR